MLFANQFAMIFIPFSSIFHFLILQFNKILNHKEQKTIRKFYKKVSRTPKNCILCESWILFKAPLCKPCRKFLYKKYLITEFQIQNIKNYPCYYLWNWKDSNDFWISKLIVGMKDGDNPALYDVFMPWLIKKISVHTDIAWVAAVPSLDRNHPDTLVEAYKKQNNNIKSFKLMKLNSQSQKLKSKFERGDTNFKVEANSNFNQKTNRAGILILDDVLATGGSFKGVLDALNNKNIRAIGVWAYRS